VVNTLTDFYAPIVQWIEHRFSKPDMGVRFFLGAHFCSLGVDKFNMVVVAQLAELLAVAEKVGGSSPLDHLLNKESPYGRFFGRMREYEKDNYYFLFMDFNN
jgi:hypothetical protein